MADLSHIAARATQVNSGDKLNFRHAERHMPMEFRCKGSDDAEYGFEMEAHVGALETVGKGGGIIRSPATELKDMTNVVVNALEPVYWNVMARDDPTLVEGAASLAIIEQQGSKSAGDYQRTQSMVH